MSFDAEVKGLEELGCEVVKSTYNSAEIAGSRKLTVSISQLWSCAAARKLRSDIQEHRPDIIHVHNIFPQISRSCYWVAHKLSVPIVQTLHNYRPICAGGLLALNGEPCNKCLNSSWQYPAIVNRCYRNNYLTSIPLVLSNQFHHQIGTNRLSNVWYTTASDFTKNKYVEAGWDASRIIVKPNLIDVPEFSSITKDIRSGVIYVGRLSEEKGIRELLIAWSKYKGNEQLTVIGNGPLIEDVVSASKIDQRIRYLGELPIEEVFNHMACSKALVQPSVCYETFGRTLAEALAVGTPIITSKGGALAEIAQRSSGYQVDPKRPDELVSAISEVTNLSNSSMNELSFKAKKVFEEYFSYSKVNQSLLSLYREILEINK